MLLEKERKKVIEIALKAQKEKLVPLTFGNFSIRDKETNYVCVTPSGIPYEDLHPSDITVVDLDNNVIDGERKQSSETPMHLAVYKVREDVCAVVHTHSTYATAWACRKIPGMPCITSEAADLVGGSVEITPFEIPGTPELAQSVARVFEGNNKKVALVGNHGTVAVDSNIDKAYDDSLILEESAKGAFIAFLLGDVNILDDSIAEEMKDYTTSNYGQGEN
ncbi:class II aldolase/adducin family protein [Anaerococcus hydrogenalis]|uniref:class II aldolase/adducin family protein n=1 Tax=Anaerococcus hydrogenalis TaxID=33029 RepID=UPI0023F505AF|nr:class II aldolase/adducin family protein [Anaerococcus hydrogenalis]